jgi:hypothetical protein
MINNVNINDLSPAQRAKYSSLRLTFLNSYFNGLREGVYTHSVTHLQSKADSVMKIMNAAYQIFNELNGLYLITTELKIQASNLQNDIRSFYTYLYKIIQNSQTANTPTPAPSKEGEDYRTKRLTVLKEAIATLQNDFNARIGAESVKVDELQHMEKAAVNIFHELTALDLITDQKIEVEKLRKDVQTLYNYLVQAINLAPRANTQIHAPSKEVDSTQRLAPEVDSTQRLALIKEAIAAAENAIYNRSDADLLSQEDAVRAIMNDILAISNELNEFYATKEKKAEVEKLYSDLTSLYNFLHKKITPLETWISELEKEFKLITQQMNAIMAVPPDNQIKHFEYLSASHDSASNNLRDLRSEIIVAGYGAESKDAAQAQRFKNLEASLSDLEKTEQESKKSIQAAYAYLYG